MRGVESTTVLHELDEHGVVTLTLNRPERNNAWTPELESALHDLLEQASSSPDVRAIVITGAGRSFCPGLDAEELDRVSQDGQRLDETGRRRLTLPTYVPKPVVCAVNGACAGLGLILALMCDIRFAASDAKITTAFVRRGLPAEEASAWMLNRIVGHARSLDLLISGRVVSGDEAAAIGLVHASLSREVLLPHAIAYARDLAANCSPRAMAAVKRQVYLDWSRALEDSRRDARRLLPVLKEDSKDFREGVRSFVERRPPQFEPLARPIEFDATSEDNRA
jgi:enoyl-CoA hydratase/carnithine racemase